MTVVNVAPGEPWRLTVIYLIVGCILFIHCLEDPDTGYYHPVLKLTFTVTFNSTNSSVDKGCGKFYAQQFLKFFQAVGRELTEKCYRNGNIGVQVDTYSTARVRLPGSEVKSFEQNGTGNASNEVDLTSHMNISATRGSTTQTDIERCGIFSKTVLQNLTRPNNFSTFDAIYELPAYSGMIDGHDEAVACGPAYLSPRAFTFEQDSWLCNGGHVFDNISNNCVVADVTMSSMSPPEVTTIPTPQTTDEVPPKFAWGLIVHNSSETLHIAEGDAPYNIHFSAWVNRTDLCGNRSMDDCVISIDVKVIVPTDSLKCRKNGQSVSQLVFGQPKHVTNGDDANFCSLRVYMNDTAHLTSYIPIKAKLDGKYDGNRTQQLTITLTRRTEEKISSETLYEAQVIIEDRDRKATCQSINDPHVTTYDGLEYNNYYEGEFILYKHKTLPFRVDVIYQKCGPGVLASCNCAVAVQSGDDVIVIDRCYRIKKPFKRLEGVATDMTWLRTDLYLNHELTEGTRIYEEADGKKINIYLPHGTYIKVMVSGELLNVWVVASPSDLKNTKGLCGSYNIDPTDDIVLQNGTQLTLLESNPTERIEPHEFIKDWRVELYGADSIFRGVAAERSPYKPHTYCECEGDALQPICGVAMDISTCDMYQGVDKTVRYVVNAKEPELYQTPRRKRDIFDNKITVDEPIRIDTTFKPPKHKWKNNYNEVIAKNFCTKYIKDDYELGKLCSQLPAVNFKQEITTCIEDIKITGNTSWADSARDAMKEQCAEEIQKNDNIPNDISYQIQTTMCIRDCSNHGDCINGECRCHVGYSTADCSIHTSDKPYVSEMPTYGLCDTRYMNCQNVILYGSGFIEGPNLTCFLQETKVGHNPGDLTKLPTKLSVPAIFINFQAVECAMPEVREYLVSISNDGNPDHISDSLLYIPFDSVCKSCDTNITSCSKKKNSCVINQKCYKEGETSEDDKCLICKSVDDEYQWSTDESNCPWYGNLTVPDWIVALAAALGGSFIGILAGFLLYRYCCKKRKSEEADEPRNESENAAFEETILHRNRLQNAAFSPDRFADFNLQQAPPPQEPYFYNDGRGVENGVDSSTYF